MWRTCFGVSRAWSRLGWFLAACAVFLPGTAEARNYPRLFGSYEFYSPNIARFHHWVEMLERQRREAAGCDTDTCKSEDWNTLIAGLKGKPLGLQLREVNDFINAQRYVLDKDNWTDPDYWATPSEFLKKSGDCEDFAIAKYMALKALGVPIENMRVAVMWDSNTKSGHAALVIYVDDEAFLLDNLIASVVRTGTVDHYLAVYSINETGWWLHKYVDEPIPQISAAKTQRNTGG
jgi:predicted transglutaminase-like cysteine proteinase